MTKVYAFYETQMQWVDSSLLTNENVLAHKDGTTRLVPFNEVEDGEIWSYGGVFTEGVEITPPDPSGFTIPGSYTFTPDDDKFMQYPDETLGYHHRLEPTGNINFKSVDVKSETNYWYKDDPTLQIVIVLFFADGGPFTSLTGNYTLNSPQGTYPSENGWTKCSSGDLDQTDTIVAQFASMGAQVEEYGRGIATEAGGFQISDTDPSML